MRSTGNTLSNQKYNPNNKSPPTTSFSGGDSSEDIELERYIRDKYERKTFMLKSRKLPPILNNPERVNGGPAAQRSPSLGSSSSTNLKPGQQRVSGESFERARSPASTNSSLEIPPAKPPRPNDPLAWTGLDSKGLVNPSPSSSVPTIKEVLFSRPSQGVENDIVLGMSSMNPFQNPAPVYTPLPPPQPLPEISSTQTSSNPFDAPVAQPHGHRTFSLQERRSPAAQQVLPPLWSPASSPHSTASNGQQIPLPAQSNVYSQSLPRVSQSSGISNPFMSQQEMSSPLATSPTNPFFPPQQTPSPVYHQPHPLYQTQTQNQPIPQPLYQNHYQQYQQAPPQQQQYVQTPLQTYTSNQINSTNPIYYPKPRMDNKSILNLYNAPPPTPSNPGGPQFIQNQANGVPTWSQQGI